MSRFDEQIKRHLTSTALHTKSYVEGTTLVLAEPVLSTTDNTSADIQTHLADTGDHLLAEAKGVTLIVSPEPGTDFIEHASDDTIHRKVSYSDGVLLFANQAINGDLVDLEKYVPQFIREMDEMHQIYKSQGREVAREWLKLEDTEIQMFPDWADWSIELWETNYGITPSREATLASRRKAVIARLTIPPTTTLALVQKTAEELIGGTIWVEEEPEKSHINIWLMDRENFEATWSDVSTKTWKDLTSLSWMKVITDLNEKAIDRNAFLDWLDTYKPAHLGYTLDYFVMRWKDCLDYTWRDLTNYTWLGVLMGLKQLVTTWRMAQTVGTWGDLDSSYTWYTTKKIKENS